MRDIPRADLPAIAAYQAFAAVSADRLGEMPPWEAIPDEAKADWRAVAGAVEMILHDMTVCAAPRHGAPGTGRTDCG